MIWSWFGLPATLRAVADKKSSSAADANFTLLAAGCGRSAFNFFQASAGARMRRVCGALYSRQRQLSRHAGSAGTQ
jgi:hypothetical protein